jgi:Ca2+-binding RTX toxin-like protein
VWPVAIVMVLAAGLLPTQSRAQQPACSNASVFQPGPICADLAPPVTIYEVLDAEDIAAAGFPEKFIDVYWVAFLSCGHWYPGVNGLDFDPNHPNEEGTPREFNEFFATWSHNNSPHVDNCSHDAPDHPGTIFAAVVQGELLDPEEIAPVRRAGAFEDDLIEIPLRVLGCGYDKGSAEGGGPECVESDLGPTCEVDTDDVAVMTGGAEVDISAQDSQLTITFPNGEAPSCTASATVTTSMTVLGEENVNDDVTIDAHVLSIVRVGMNLQTGDEDTLTVDDTSGDTAVTLNGYLPKGELVQGGTILDFFDDGRFDLGTTAVEHILLNLGDGNDKITVNIENLYPLVGATGYKTTFDGGPGRDLVVLQGDAAYGYSEYFGMAPGPTPTAQVNLNGDQDDIVDVAAVAVERWTVSGTDDDDVISGAGGQGTGGPFAFPLKLFGEGSNDRLTGGLKADNLNGGPGRKDVCKGGKGTDEASGCETVKGIP